MYSLLLEIKKFQIDYIKSIKFKSLLLSNKSF